MANRLAVSALVVAGVSFTMAGCMGSYEPTGNEYPDPEPIIQAPAAEPVEPAFEAPAPQPAPMVWTCSYAPTMDYDWHDDVVCSNGSEWHRPYLREWDSFVTEDEIMASALEYEAELNASLGSAAAPATTGTTNGPRWSVKGAMEGQGWPDIRGQDTEQ